MKLDGSVLISYKVVRNNYINGAKLSGLYKGICLSVNCCVSSLFVKIRSMHLPDYCDRGFLIISRLVDL